MHPEEAMNPDKYLEDDGGAKERQSHDGASKTRGARAVARQRYSALEKEVKRSCDRTKERSLSSRRNRKYRRPL